MPGQRVVALHERRAGAQALSAWLGRAKPAAVALPPSVQPRARQRLSAPKTLGKRPLGPHARNDQLPRRRANASSARERTTHPASGGGGGTGRNRPPAARPPTATLPHSPPPPPPQPAVAAWSPTPTGPPPGRQTAAPAGVACAAALLPGTSSPPAGGGDLLYIVIKTNEAALCNATKGQPRKTEFRPRSCNGIRPGLPGQNQAELPVFQGLVRKELVASLWTNTCSILCGALVPITTCLCDGRGGGTPAASNGWTGNTNRIAQMLCQANRAIAQSLHRTYGKLRWGRGRGTHKCDVFGVLTVAPMARHLGVWRWCLVQALHFGSVGPLLHFTSATRSHHMISKLIIGNHSPQCHK